MLKFANQGQDILETNYWDTPKGRSGYAFLSCHEGAGRLLLSRDMAERCLARLEAASEAILSSGPWRHAGPEEGRMTLEIMFDTPGQDAAPLAVHLSPRQCDQGEPPAPEGEEFPLTVWTQDAAGQVRQLRALSCRYRKVGAVPCLESWDGLRTVSDASNACLKH
ncbi:MAG: hypothetical protein KBE25_00235 [Laribacter sp.]|nr:hypothetical protein [Laribacter sp.]MBP9526754.1 hypothetical protein [Laribacter sp.]MBP9607773.1 hypothetical protein [Laribacter sp.]